MFNKKIKSEFQGTDLLYHTNMAKNAKSLSLSGVKRARTDRV
jgi:hypothetical protein